MRATIPSKIGMAPPHPGAFIRDEILDELGLSVSAAAKALGVGAPPFPIFSTATRLFPQRWRSGSRRPSAWIWRRCLGCKPGTTPSPCVAGKSALSAIGSRC